MRESDGEHGSLPPASADPTLLREVFANLLSNAVKFTGRKADPRIDIEGWHEAVPYRLQRARQRRGFRQREARSLFMPFRRLHPERAVRREQASALSLVRRIIERHGGQVAAEGEVGKGSVLPDFASGVSRRTQMRAAAPLPPARGS